MAYTQGQFDQNLYHLLGDDEKYVMQRDADEAYRYIPRERPYDPNSLLQIWRSAHTHDPQTVIKPVESVPFQIASVHRVPPPFLFDAPASKPGNHAGRQQTFGIPISLPIQPQTAVDLSLWSRDRSVEKIIRAGPQYTRYMKKVFHLDVGAGHEEYMMVLAAETLYNFNPDHFAGVKDLVMNAKSAQTAYHNITQYLLQQIAHALRVNYKGQSFVTLLHTMLAQQANLRHAFDARRPALFQEHANRLFVLVQDREFVQLAMVNKLIPLSVWLFAPHPLNEQEGNDDYEYVMFSLAMLVETGRMPTHQEWHQRRTEGGAGFGHMAGTSYEQLHRAQAAKNSAELHKALGGLSNLFQKLDDQGIGGGMFGHLSSIAGVAHDFELSQFVGPLQIEIEKAMDGVPDHVRERYEQMKHDLESNTYSIDGLMNLVQRFHDLRSTTVHTPEPPAPAEEPMGTALVPSGFDFTQPPQSFIG